MRGARPPSGAAITLCCPVACLAAQGMLPPDKDGDHTQTPSRRSPALAPRLEAIADAGGLTDKVLEVLPVCTTQVQQQLVGFLPEVASPDEHERVVEALLGCVAGG